MVIIAAIIIILATNLLCLANLLIAVSNRSAGCSFLRFVSESLGPLTVSDRRKSLNSAKFAKFDIFRLDIFRFESSEGN